MKMNLGKRNGSALLTALGIVAVVSVVCGMLGVTAMTQTRSAQITREMLKARMIAESGLNKAYHAVKENFSLVNGYQLNESFAGGAYKVRAVPLAGGVDVNRAQLFAEGTYGLGNVVVAADLENRTRAVTDGDGSGDFFNLIYDLLVGGSMDLKGNFNASVTAIHANGNAAITGSANVDAKTVSSAKTVTWKKPDGTVTLLSNQTPKEILTLALMDAINSFKAFAEKNNAVYASGGQVPQSPPGGVAYCTGSSDGWNGQGTGCFIFEGDVSFQGSSMNVSSVSGYPALIVLSASDVKFNAGTEIHGAILLPNASLKINGHAAVYGPVLVGQTMTGNGTADFYAGDGQGFNLPPKESLTDNVVITAWH